MSTKRLRWALPMFALAIAGLVLAFASTRGRHTAEPAAAARRVVHGKVWSGADRTPVPNARVVFHAMPAEEMSERPTLDWKRFEHTLLEVRTDAQGAYSAALPSGGPYSMSVFAHAHAPSVRQVDGTSPANVDVELRTAGFDFVVRVRDSAAAPIERAQVFLFSHAGQMVAQGTSDSSGVFGQLLPGGVYYAGVRARGYASLLERRFILADEHSTVVLHTQRPLDVHVRHSGQPLQGARVFALDPMGIVAAEGTTDSSGTAHIPHLALGDYKIWAGLNQLAGEAPISPSPGAAKRTIEVSVTQVSPHLDLLVDSKCSPRVTALTRAHGDVILRQAFFPVVAAVGHGKRLSLVLPPVEQRLLVHCGERAARIEHSPKRPAPTELSFHSMTEARGAVRAPDGAPLSAAAVTYEPATGAPWSVVALTDQHGNFALRDLPGGPGTVTAYHPNFGRVSGAVPGARSAEQLVLQFEPKHFVNGHVRTSAGKPIAGARVAVSTASGAGLSAESDADGSFRVGPLAKEQGLLLVFNGGAPLQDEPLLIHAERSTDLDVVINERVR